MAQAAELVGLAESVAKAEIAETGDADTVERQLPQRVSAVGFDSPAHLQGVGGAVADRRTTPAPKFT